MSDEKKPQLALVDYFWNAINLNSLRGIPERHYVMQLCVMLNDLDSISYLEDLLIQKELEHEANQIDGFWPAKWLEGVRLFLLRQNILALFEGMKTIDVLIQKVGNFKPTDVKKMNKKNRMLAQLIVEDKILKPYLEELDSCLNRHVEKQQDEIANHSNTQLSETQRTSLYQSMAFVRDNLSGHADEQALKQGKTYLIEQGFDEGIAAKRCIPSQAELTSFESVAGTTSFQN